MRAVVMREFGEPDVLHVETRPDPPCGPRDIIVKVASCGIDRHDIVVRAGIMRRKTRSYRGAFGGHKEDITFPLVPGLEIAGDVVEVGDEVKSMSAAPKLGDRVATLPRTNHCGGCLYCRTGREENCLDAEFLGHDVDGGYAEFVRVQWDSVLRIPDNVEYDSAALAGACVGTVVRAVRDIGKARPGEKVLVTGAGGGLGTHAIQIAKACGAQVIAVTSSAHKREALAATGADQVVVYQRGEGFSKQVAEVTHGQGVDVAIDTVGAAVFNEVWRSMAEYGRIVLVGELGGSRVDFRPSLVFLRRLQILGSYSPGLTHLDAALGLLASGQVKAAISHRLPLEQAAEAHRMVEEDNPFGRVLLHP